MDKKAQIAIVIVAIILIAAVAAVVVNNQGKDGTKDKEASDDAYYKNGITIKNSIPSTTTPNTFTLYEKPQRVVCLFPGNVELMCMFGLEDLVVGSFVKAANLQTLNPEYQKTYDALNPTVVPNNAFSREEVMACNPDLILGWSSSFKDSLIGTIDSWNDIGVNCYRTNLYGNSEGSSVDTYYQMIRDIGAMFNLNDRANEIISQWNTIVKQNADMISAAGITEKKKVLIVDYKKDTSAGKTFEEIAAMDFDVVLIGAIGYNTGMTKEQHDEVVQWFYDIPVWSHFKDKQVEAVPFYTLYMSGILGNNCLTEIFENLYPELKK